MNYLDFVNSKRVGIEPSGFDVSNSAINPMLFDFQRDIVRWSLRRGKAAIFLDCGMGKTPCCGSHGGACADSGTTGGVCPDAARGGIGSEGYEALRHGRKFVGCELKPSYWRNAIRNLESVEIQASTPTLFDFIPQDAEMAA